MANTIKKGESLFIPFKNGVSIYDSQLKPRMYKTKDQYDRFSYRFKDAEMVEYVEVVRCKDCRWARKKDHREPTDTPRELICQCFMHHYIPAPWGARRAVKPDDFCSNGERKDNG